MRDLNKCAANGHCWRNLRSKGFGLARRPDRLDPGQPRRAQRALARDFPPDRRELSDDRRAGRLAQSGAHPADRAVAGLGAQRDVGPRAARPDLCAAYLGRPAADRARPALFRRRADGGRRSHRRRPPLDRGAGRRRRQQQVAGVDPHRGLADAVGADPLRQHRAHRQEQRAAQAHRIRAARSRARAGGAGGRGRRGREPRAQYPGRPADLGADRGRQLPQRAHPRPHAGRAAQRDRERGQAGPGRARPVDAEGHRGRLCQLVGRRRAKAAS